MTPATDPRPASGRAALPLLISDASSFARKLGHALQARHDAALPPPGHVELLNLLAKALGHRNLQSLQAAQRAGLPGVPLATEDRPPPLALTDNARKALGQFDSRGRLLRWPVKFSVQRLAMWVLWTLFDGRRVYTEREVNQVLMAANAFGDHATLRRELINHQLMSRKPDCSDYRKLPARPDDETRALLQAWRLQRRTRQPRPGSPPQRAAAAAATTTAQAG